MHPSEKKEAAKQIKKALQKEFNTKYHYFSVKQSYAGFMVEWKGFLNGSTTAAVKKVANNWNTCRDVANDGGDPIWVGESISYYHWTDECPEYDGWDYEKYQEMIVDLVCREHGVEFDPVYFRFNDVHGYGQDSNALGEFNWYKENNSCRIEDRPEDYNEVRYCPCWSVSSVSPTAPVDVAVETDSTEEVAEVVQEELEQEKQQEWSGLPGMIQELVNEVARLQKELQARDLQIENLEKQVKYEQELRSRIVEQRDEAEMKVAEYQLEEESQEQKKQEAWAHVEKQAETIGKLNNSMQEAAQMMGYLEKELSIYRALPMPEGDPVTQKDLEHIANKIAHYLIQTGGESTDFAEWLPNSKNEKHRGLFLFAMDTLGVTQKFAELYVKNTLKDDPHYQLIETRRRGKTRHLVRVK